jgi:hypothetical protein
MFSKNVSDSASSEHHRRRKRFHLIHSIASVALLLVIQGTIGILASTFWNESAYIFVILTAAVVGGLGIILVATEVIREIRNALHMLFTLSAVLSEFIVFFACQYWFLSLMAPGSFQSLQIEPIDLLLHSTMVFALNPLYLPTTSTAEALLLINTIESLVLAHFVLQNVWQFRGNVHDNPGKSTDTKIDSDRLTQQSTLPTS